MIKPWTPGLNQEKWFNETTKIKVYNILCTKKHIFKERNCENSDSKKEKKNVEGKKERKKEVVKHNWNFCVLRVKIIVPLCWQSSPPDSTPP